MLTGKQVRVRFARDRIVPAYLDPAAPEWQEVAERLLEMFRSMSGQTRGEVEQEIADAFGDDPQQQIIDGLAKVLEDRCEFEVVPGKPPEEVRERVFAVAAEMRKGGAFDRASILGQIGQELKLAPADVEVGLFADLKSEQRLAKFRDLSAERLLHRYNVALAQAVLLRSTGVNIYIKNEPPQRYRQLLRMVKFHRLIAELHPDAANTYRLHLDGPLSLFSATQKYGLQLALFLPAVLQCADFILQAELIWGPQRKPKRFFLASKDGLESHLQDTGSWVPAELKMFGELFRKKVADWELVDEPEILPLADGTFWVPDYRLVQKKSGKTVYLEVLGFWRKSSVEKHLERLKAQAKVPFVLAVSDQLHIEEKELAEVPAGVHRFRNLPLPDEIIKLAEQQVT